MGFQAIFLSVIEKMKAKTFKTNTVATYLPKLTLTCEFNRVQENKEI